MESEDKVKHVVTCQIHEEGEELPRLPIIISK